MTSAPRPRPLDLHLEHLTKPLLWYYGTNLATETTTIVIIRGIKERMTTKIINLLEKQATISHTRSPQLDIKQLKWSRLIKTLGSCPGMKLHITARRQGDETLLRLFIWAGVPADRPAAGGSAAARRWSAWKVLEAASRALKRVYTQPAVFFKSLFPRQPVRPHITLTLSAEINIWRLRQELWASEIENRASRFSCSHGFRSWVISARVWGSSAAVQVKAVLDLTLTF